MKNTPNTPKLDTHFTLYLELWCRGNTEQRATLAQKLKGFGDQFEPQILLALKDTQSQEYASQFLAECDDEGVAELRKYQPPPTRIFSKKTNPKHNKAVFNYIYQRGTSENRETLKTTILKAGEASVHALLQIYLYGSNRASPDALELLKELGEVVLPELWEIAPKAEGESRERAFCLLAYHTDDATRLRLLAYQRATASENERQKEWHKVALWLLPFGIVGGLAAKIISMLLPQPLVSISIAPLVLGLALWRFLKFVKPDYGIPNTILLAIEDKRFVGVISHTITSKALNRKYYQCAITLLERLLTQVTEEDQQHFLPHEIDALTLLAQSAPTELALKILTTLEKVGSTRILPKLRPLLKPAMQPARVVRAAQHCIEVLQTSEKIKRETDSLLRPATYTEQTDTLLRPAQHTNDDDTNQLLRPR